MGRRVRAVNTATKCTCNKCEMEVGSAIPGKPHRKCSGKKNGPSRDHGNYIDACDRGKWEPSEM